MGWLTALGLVVAAWSSWRFHQERKARLARPSNRAPKTTPNNADAQAVGTIDLAGDGSLRRFVPPQFDSVRDLGGMVMTFVTEDGEVERSPTTDYASEATELLGLVDDAKGFVSAHGKAIADGWKIHSFRLAAWAVDGESAQQRELKISRPIPDKKFHSDIAAGKVVRMRVFIDDTGTKAVVDELVARDEPLGEFSSILARLQQPLRVTTPDFGSLEYDRKRRCFEGASDWDGQPIGLSFDVTSADAVEQLLTTSRALWEAQRSWQCQVDAALSKELLESANDWAHDMDDPPMSAEEFLERLTLERITLGSTGRFTFWFNDGDVFGGHVVEASGTIADGIDHCVYEG